MAKLINGNGNPAVYASEDSDWFAAIMGNVTSITAIGEQFRADQADANTIEVFDGVIITQEGRRIQLDANDVDLFSIPTGTPGDTSYYIIGYHLVTDADSNQSCETFVQKMEDGTETIPEDTFRGGSDDVYISLYRVTQDGLNIDSIDLLLPLVANMGNFNANNKIFKASFQGGKYGFDIDGVFYPIGGGSEMKVLKYGTITTSSTISLDVTLDPSKYFVLLNTNKYQYRQDQTYSVAYAYGNGAYISAKTSTSVTIAVDSGLTCSYEIVQISE